MTPKSILTSIKEHFTKQAVIDSKVLILITLGCVAYYWVSLFSFQLSDSSLITLTDPPKSTKNLAGEFGAQLSGFVLFYTGLLSFALPLPLVLALIQLVIGEPKSLQHFFIGILLLFVGCYFFNLFLPVVHFKGFETPSGGMLGHLLEAKLSLMLGTVGSSILLGTLLGICFYRLTPNLFLQTLKLPGVLLKKLLLLLSAPFILAYSSFKQLMMKKKTPQSLKTKPRTHKTSRKPASPPKNNKPSSALSPLDRTQHVFKISPEPLSQAPKKDHSLVKETILSTLADFKIHGTIVDEKEGPVCTTFSFQPDKGIKQSRIYQLIDDLALALKVDSLFIVPVRNESALGLQVPNKNRETVFLGDILTHREFREHKSPLTFALGREVSGKPLYLDLCKMPHLLIAGATGSGKSVCINTLVCSVLTRTRPDEAKLILVDPKMLELSLFKEIPHLQSPVITRPEHATQILRWLVTEMDRRYNYLEQHQFRNLGDYRDARKKPEHAHLKNLPYILIIIDELADLMLTASKEIEKLIQRLAQKARASGIHMVLATQRPSVDVITGVIKANFPCRLSFQVSSKHDSRTILDQIGAEKLLGLGDFILQKPGTKPIRGQGCYISDSEVLELVEELRSPQPMQFDQEILDFLTAHEAENGLPEISLDQTDQDPLMTEAVNIAKEKGSISSSFLQRSLQIGYNRAARIVDSMTHQGLISDADGSKPRKWLGA